MDRAGKEYWDGHWDTVEHSPFRPDSGQLRDYRDRVLADLLAKALRGLPADANVLEAGCADSTLLPYLAAKGYRVTGIDYSQSGCERFMRRLPGAHVECADIFNPPGHLLASADLVLSYGLAEHFENTADCVRALAAFAKPNGRVLTIIPNMRGLVGLVQRICGPKIYAIHVPLSLQELKHAHNADELEILETCYLLPAGFGVVNFHEPAKPAVLWIRRLAIAALARLSWITWAMRLPSSELLSPYCYCLATRRAKHR